MDVSAARHRRRRVTALLLALAAVASLGTPAARATGPELRPDVLNVTGWTRLATPKLAGTTLAGPGLPGPGAGDGIGPGSYLIIDQDDGNSYLCTANFVWTRGTTKYLGAAGHCFLRPGDAVAPGSPGARVDAVSVCVADCAFGGQIGSVIQGEMRLLGPVAYARQSRGGIDVGNDFGLVEIPTGLSPLVRRAVPVWGGPTGAAPIGVNQPVCLYGNAGGLGEVFATKARAGLGASSYPSGSWYANIPSAPGDSGSALVNCPNLVGTTAVGILTHLATDGSGVVAGTTVARAKKMVADDLGLAITLATA